MRILVKQIIDCRYFLWTLLLLPSLPMLVALLDGGIRPDGKPVTEALLQPTGELAARLMIVAMALSPLRMLFPHSRFLGWIIKRRRYLGVAAFGYALAHTVLYVIDMGSIHAILDEFGALGIWTGWLAFLILVPLAMTSNNASVCLMGRSWKLLQRFVYPAAIATLVHWIFVHNNLRSALVHFLPIALLEGYRVWHMYARIHPHRMQQLDREKEILMKRLSISVIILATAALVPVAAGATGLLTCDSGDPSKWITEQAMTERLTAKGWQVRFIKEDGGCWEVYGTTPEGQRAEAYFHPVTGEKLLVSQRGRILFRADGASGSRE